jgi:hypothetical protein
MAFNQTVDQVEALEARGAKLAQECGWNGDEIFAIVYHALSAAKFHKQAEELLDLRDKLYE